MFYYSQAYAPAGYGTRDLLIAKQIVSYPLHYRGWCPTVTLTYLNEVKFGKLGFSMGIIEDNCFV